jgi:hypothetical protein
MTTTAATGSATTIGAVRLGSPTLKPVRHFKEHHEVQAVRSATPAGSGLPGEETQPDRVSRHVDERDARLAFRQRN